MRCVVVTVFVPVVTLQKWEWRGVVGVNTHGSMKEKLRFCSTFGEGEGEKRSASLLDKMFLALELLLLTMSITEYWYGTGTTGGTFCCRQVVDVLVVMLRPKGLSRYFF